MLFILLTLIIDQGLFYFFVLDDRILFTLLIYVSLKRRLTIPEIISLIAIDLQILSPQVQLVLARKHRKQDYS